MRSGSDDLLPTASPGRAESRRPPSIDTVARHLARQFGLPHPLAVDAARAAVAQASAAGEPGDALAVAEALARRARRRLLTPVINATGVLLHTNLGRAPRPAPSGTGALRYTNVELDLVSGQRGSRHDIAGPLLARACGAESALVVNNCAAAVLLVLAALAHGRSVAVSRGELVEIGGGFRIPEVLEQSGAGLVEVGTTNRTRADDYRRALAGDASVAMLLSVHRSNYRIEGFTESVGVHALRTLADEHPDRAVTVVADVGSGLLDAATPWLADSSGAVPALPWLSDEPAVRQTLAAGADLVTFSGDKLLGGPQAGIIAGRAALVALCARHPLARALRPGALVLADLEETALAYLRGEGTAVPFWQMATAPVPALIARAESFGRPWVETAAVPGGGTLPGRTIPSIALRLIGDHREALRAFDPPVIARVEQGATLCDLRTVDPADDSVLADAIGAACTS